MGGGSGVLFQVGVLEMRWRGGGGSGVLCQVGVLEMRWRREWCVISGGRA